MKNCPACHNNYDAEECPECGWPHTAVDEPIHNWFELSYAQYLTIPRSVLQSMPVEWQERFVKCLIELDNTIDWRPQAGIYRVTLCELKEVWDDDLKCYMEEWGNELHDPLQDYDRGRRRIPHGMKQLADFNDDELDTSGHSLDCICATCIQDHPERFYP